MRYLRFSLFVLGMVSTAFACELQYDSMSAAQYYRAQGWQLTGVKDFDSAVRLNSYALPTAEAIPGVVAQVLPHSEPYVVEFPAEEFVLNGARKRTRAAQSQASIVRWMTHGRTVAYTYSLVPVQAHRGNGGWVIDSEAACIYYATFIDDKGDGVYRVLVPDRFTADLVPSWARAKKN